MGFSLFVAGEELLVLQALWLMIPAYVANMVPTVAGGGPPLDGGRSWTDGRRLLGDGKTWRGLAIGVLAGTLTGIVMHFLAPAFPGSWGLSNLGSEPVYILVAMLLSTGALFGDSVKSFVKRRLNINRGAMWFGPDQLDFVFGALVFLYVGSEAMLFAGALDFNWVNSNLSLVGVVAVLILTPMFHLATNALGHKLGWKEVPW